MARVWYAWYEEVKAWYAWYAKFGGGGCGYNFVWTFICHDDYNTLKTHSSIGKSWFEVVRVWYAWYEQVKAEYAWYAKFRGGGPGL